MTDIPDDIAAVVESGITRIGEIFGALAALATLALAAFPAAGAVARLWSWLT